MPVPAPRRVAPQELAESHVNLVTSIAHRVRRELDGRVDFDDLFGPGLEGLVTAARRYDPRRGASFATFAGYRVRGAMIDAARAAKPYTLVTVDKLGAVPCPRASVEADAVVAETHSRLRRAVAALPTRERHFVVRVYFEGAQLAQAGSEVGVSKSWASRIHARAMRRLRKAMRAI